ncbi:MAG: phosphate ABC transporter substrate-binding protein PstS [Armatimonadota bacterium]
MQTTGLRLPAICALATLLIAGCAPKQNSQGSNASGQTVVGAGSTFVYPIMAKWSQDYSASNGLKVDYQSIGSGGGIKQFKSNTVQFGATDVALDDEAVKEIAKPFIQFPVIAGTVALVYNLPEVKQPLNLPQKVVAGIFLGSIKTWNDPAITAANAGVTLPSTPIVLAHRSDGSGTTYIVTDFLSTVSPEWKTKVGKGKAVQWPVGVGAKGNEGVTNQVQQTVGAFGYVELAYAKQNKLQTASVENAEGKYVLPSSESGAAATQSGVGLLKTDLRSSLVNMSGEKSYPIAGMVYVLLYKDSSKEITGFFNWVLTDGQKRAAELDYVPLHPDVAALAQQLLKSN